MRCLEVLRSSRAASVKKDIVSTWLSFFIPTSVGKKIVKLKFDRRNTIAAREITYDRIHTSYEGLRGVHSHVGPGYACEHRVLIC